MKRTWLTILSSAGLFVGVICLGDDLQNRQLLETLPRERRESLAENLHEFDRLSSAEQTAIRRLDKTIATMEPLAQARYRALLQHYHLWVQGLTIEQRDQLNGITDLDERFALARKIRLAEKATPSRDGPRIAQIRIGEFGLLGPFEAAYLLKVWHDIAPEKRLELEKLSPAKIRDELKSQRNSTLVKFERFPADQEKSFSSQFEADPDFKIIEPLLRRNESAARKVDATKKAVNAQKRWEHPFAELLYFEANRPRLVDPIRLERFAASCPDWFHSLTDSLAGDDARDYYTTLYRLIYPSPTEMPEPSKGNKSPTEPAKKTPRVKADPGAVF